MIKRLLRPLEIYVLSIAFFFSISFDRNLNLDDVEDSPVKKNIRKYSPNFGFVY